MQFHQNNKIGIQSLKSNSRLVDFGLSNFSSFFFVQLFTCSDLESYSCYFGCCSIVGLISDSLSNVVNNLIPVPGLCHHDIHELCRAISHHLCNKNYSIDSNRANFCAVTVPSSRFEAFNDPLNAVAVTVPFTSRAVAGFVLPMPTPPEARIRN